MIRRIKIDVRKRLFEMEPVQRDHVGIRDIDKPAPAGSIHGIRRGIEKVDGMAGVQRHEDLQPFRDNIQREQVAVRAKKLVAQDDGRIRGHEPHLRGLGDLKDSYVKIHDASHVRQSRRDPSDGLLPLVIHFEEASRAVNTLMRFPVNRPITDRGPN